MPRLTGGGALSLTLSLTLSLSLGRQGVSTGVCGRGVSGGVSSQRCMESEGLHTPPPPPPVPISRPVPVSLPSSGVTARLSVLYTSLSPPPLPS